MPDFTLKPSFPIASVIDAAQRNAQLQEQSREAGNQSLLAGLKSIGDVGQSLYAQKKQVAQALALKKALIPELDDETARTMEPDQVLHAAGVLHKTADVNQLMEVMRNNMLPKNPATVAPATPTPAQPATPSASPTPGQPGASLPLDHSGDLASISPTIPSPPQVTSATMPFGGGSTATAPSPTPVPIPAPPVNSRMNPATIALAKSLGLFTPNEKVMTTQDALDAGSVPKGTIIKDLPKSGAPKDIMAPEYQEKLEKQYQDMKMKALSNRSGGLGLQDSKVNQAFDLRKLVNKYYDPKTGDFNIPPSQHAELALGLARLVSPTGQVGIELMHELRQATGREALSKALIYAGADPSQVGGPTQTVAKMFVDSIDRQGETAEQLRDQYQQYISDNAPTDLEPARKAKHDRAKLNSFNDFLSKSPDRMAASGINLSGGDAARLAELRAKKAAGTLGH